MVQMGLVGVARRSRGKNDHEGRDTGDYFLTTLVNNANETTCPLAPDRPLALP